MSKPIPGMHIPITSAGGYESYYYTRQMVRKHSDRYKDIYHNAKGTRELAKKMGVTNLSKLFGQRQLWDALSGPVAKAYFEAIGITESMLATTIELDQEHHANHVAKPVTYDSAYIQQRWFVQRLSFDEELNEQDAIKLCEIEFAKKFPNYDPNSPGRNYYCTLNRSPLYDILIDSTGAYYWYMKPDFTLEKGDYTFSHPRVLGLSLR
ncbi:MAG: hypothetical protein PF588_03015 [Candidatus Kapabacteria bacterium]|nr:hypothetical protein [Candidatus Kapabacteria bacterium]